jgi:hypothetical protein
MNENFMYYVNGHYFKTLNEARNYACGDHGRDVLLTYGDYDCTVLSYHPMSERLERVTSVKEAKEKLYGGNMIRNNLLNNEIMKTETQS